MLAQLCPYSFSAKNGPQMGSTGGGEKPRLHLKDKFRIVENKGICQRINVGS